MLLVLAALALAGCGSSDAGRASTAAAVRPELDAAARRADLRRAESLISGVPRAAGYRIVLAPRRNPDVRALTDTGRRTITLFLARDDAPHRTAHDLAHELGHVYDAEHMTDAARRAYLVRRGAAGTPWWPGSGRTDYRTGAGDFAEVFALCHAASPEFRSRVAARPADACGLLPKGARS